MSGVDLIGAIEPWPSSHASLPDGWSWGDNPQIAQVQAHKSRLILQADALASLAAPDDDDRAWMHALYRGAAAWELWLLQHDTHATSRAKQQCAHSALSLAELSHDLNLAEDVLTCWRAIGPTHARFYRDGQKRLEKQGAAFKRQIKALTLNALIDRHDRGAAESFLHATAPFVREGGLGELTGLRALAMEVLGYPAAEVVGARFRACVAFPTDPHAFSAYLLALSRFTLDGAPSPVLGDGLRWFRDDLGVQASALTMRDRYDEDTIFGESLESQVAHVARLALASQDTYLVDHAVFFCVKHLKRKAGRLQEAMALMDEALRRHPRAPAIRVFRALTAHELALPDAFADLSAMLREADSAHVPPWLWQVAGEVFGRGQRWEEAVRAFHRGGVDAEGFTAVAWINQYAIALARSGAPDAARTVLERALRLVANESLLRHNLDVLAGQRAEALRPHTIDPFAAARFDQAADRLDYATAA